MQKYCASNLTDERGKKCFSFKTFKAFDNLLYCQQNTKENNESKVKKEHASNGYVIFMLLLFISQIYKSKRFVFLPNECRQTGQLTTNTCIEADFTSNSLFNS